MSEKKEKYQPPFLGSKILELFLPYESKDFLLGDFASIYYDKREKKGRIYSFLWYWLQIFINAPSFIFSSVQWGIIMFKNYLKVTFRSLKKQKLFSLINVGGLALGLSAFLLISLYVMEEYSYDKFHKDSDRLYRLSNMLNMNDDWVPAALTPPGWFPIIKKDFPEVEKNVLLSTKFTTKFAYEKNQFSQALFYATEDFFDVLSFQLLSGNKETALKEPNSVVLTESLAKKLFGESEATDKIIEIDNEEVYKVTGIVEDVPRNSTLQFDALVSMASQMTNESGREWLSSLTGSNFLNYIKFRDNTDIKLFDNKVKFHFKKYSDDPQMDKMKPFLEKVEDIYLYSEAMYFGNLGNINHLYTMCGIAFFILVMAGVNFTNLSTSTATQKAKEIGIRKVNGGVRSNIITQILADSIVVSFLALLLAFCFMPFLIGYFNELSGKNFEVAEFMSLNIFLVMGFITLLTGGIAGIYPAIYLSSFTPASILKGDFSKKKSTAGFRKMLVVFQFTTSLVLIVSTFILNKQVSFLRYKDVGFSKDNIVTLPLNNSGIREDAEVFRNKLISDENIINASISSRVMGKVLSGWYMANEEGQRFDCTALFIDQNYIDTYSLEVVSGRKLRTDNEADKRDSYIINETAAKMLGYDDPIGKPIEIAPELKGTIVGVVKDFNFKSLHQNIEPLVMKYYWASFLRKYINVKIAGGQTEAALASIKNYYGEFSPEADFNPTFLDEFLNRLYQDEERLGKIVLGFSILAIIIGCLGLFGLSAFSAVKRKKEIGIRKVLGSSETEIVKMLVMDFTKLIGISILISIPFSYWIAKQYLDSFPYKTEIGFEVFLYSGGIALVIASLTVGYHAVKAAIANPVDSIKYE